MCYTVPYSIVFCSSLFHSIPCDSVLVYLVPTRGSFLHALCNPEKDRTDAPGSISRRCPKHPNTAHVAVTRDFIRELSPRPLNPKLSM